MKSQSGCVKCVQEDLTFSDGLFSRNPSSAIFSLVEIRLQLSPPVEVRGEDILQQSESFRASACSLCDRAGFLQCSLITPLRSSPGAVDAACPTELSLRHQKSALSLALIPHKRPGLKPGKEQSQNTLRTLTNEQNRLQM